jgi:hypothetical protein
MIVFEEYVIDENNQVFVISGDVPYLVIGNGKTFLN